MAGKNIVANLGAMPNSPSWLDRNACWVALLAAIPATEWLREPAGAWVAVAGIVGVFGVARMGRASAAARAVVGAGLLLVAALVVGQIGISRIQRDWPGEREQRVSRAFQRLSGELRATLRSTERLADQALRVAEGDRSAAFKALDRDSHRRRDGDILEPAESWPGRPHRWCRTLETTVTARFSRFRHLKAAATVPGGVIATA
jgi:hypothetical protein